MSGAMPSERAYLQAIDREIRRIDGEYDELYAGGRSSDEEAMRELRTRRRALERMKEQARSGDDPDSSRPRDPVTGAPLEGRSLEDVVRNNLLWFR
jgi:hypothetical protein